MVEHNCLSAVACVWKPRRDSKKQKGFSLSREGFEPNTFEHGHIKTASSSESQQQFSQTSSSDSGSKAEAEDPKVVLRHHFLFRVKTSVFGRKSLCIRRCKSVWDSIGSACQAARWCCGTPSPTPPRPHACLQSSFFSYLRSENKNMATVVEVFMPSPSKRKTLPVKYFAVFTHKRPRLNGGGNYKHATFLRERQMFFGA